MDEKPIVFVSCGQLTSQEIELGSSIENLVNTLTPFRGYFAQNQSTFRGFTEHILSALDRCGGLIAVLHHRGVVKTPVGEHMRASIWIEQEIAVAAFLEQILKRKIMVQIYVQTGIKREGMRDKLLLNAVEFTTHEEILTHLRTTLPTWEITSPRRGDVQKSIENVKLRCHIEQGIPNAYLVYVVNESDEQVRLRRIWLASNGHDLTTPHEFPPHEDRLLRPHVPTPVGWSPKHDPVSYLVRVSRDEGVVFDANIDVVFDCEILGERTEKRVTRRVAVFYTGSKIVDKGPKVN